ncbi:hypothetical protein [Streptomyces sp. NPDC048192]
MKGAGAMTSATSTTTALEAAHRERMKADTQAGIGPGAATGAGIPLRSAS